MTESKKGPQWQVLIMIGIITGVMFASYYMLPKTEEERKALLENLGTTNHGILISPLLPVEALPIHTRDGSTWQQIEEKSRWRLLIPGDGACQGDCRSMVYTSRQVHLRLGKYTTRFERIYITDEPLTPEFTEYLKEHPYLKIFHTDVDAVRTWLQTSGVEYREGMAILVDQGGNAMMTFDAHNTGNEMLEDLNHLLKYSPG